MKAESFPTTHAHCYIHLRHKGALLVGWQISRDSLDPAVFAIGRQSDRISLMSLMPGSKRLQIVRTHEVPRTDWPLRFDDKTRVGSRPCAKRINDHAKRLALGEVTADEKKHGAIVLPGRCLDRL